MKKEAEQKPIVFGTNGEGLMTRVPRLSSGRSGTGNLVVQGENLSVLRALARGLSGQFRCVYLDPPYNNREEYNHYRDDQDHGCWLDGLRTRLEAMWGLLREDGSLWISIDDSEAHYLKVAADGVFGRASFVTTVVWNHRTTRENRRAFSTNHEYIFVYAKDKRLFTEKRHRLDATPEMLGRYKNPDSDPRGPWQSVSANVQAGHATQWQFYDVVSPNGRRHKPPKGRCWVYNETRMSEEIKKENVYFGADGAGVPRLKIFLRERSRGLTPDTLWMAADVGTTKMAKKHLLRIFPEEEVFDTPKPEELLHRILTIATDPGDLVLDPYLGSGTTAAVAHKMGRVYVGIEEGDHAITHCAARLRLVIDGEPGGISALAGWKGGGGFDFCRMRASRCE